jgi:hypothetical protein
MNLLRFAVALLCLVCFSAFAADEPDTRPAKVTDRADATSQVSALVVSNLDERFGFDKSDDHGRMIVATGTVDWAIPLRSVSTISLSGDEAWTVKFQTKDGEATVSGALETAAILGGSSGFGSFSLPLARLKRLEFDQPGKAASPAKRPNIFDQDAHLRPANFGAILTLTDGSHLPAAQFRRNQISAESISDPALIGRPSYAVVCTNYTDFRLVRGETLQTIPFENLKTAEFLPDDVVVVTIKGGTEAKMQLPHRSDELLEGFTGTSTKGDFYVPLKFVRSITFVEEQGK